jgi:hypothetical protein
MSSQVTSIPWDPSPDSLTNMDVTQRQALLEHSVEVFWLFINAVIIFWMQVRVLSVLPVDKARGLAAAASGSASVLQ